MNKSSIIINKKIVSVIYMDVKLTDIALWADNTRVKYDIEEGGIKTSKVKHEKVIEWMFKQTSVSKDNCGGNSLINRIKENKKRTGHA